MFKLLVGFYFLFTSFQITIYWRSADNQGRNRHIFLRGAKPFSSFFPCVKWVFSRLKVPILVDPKQIFLVFKSEKQKKGSSPLFVTFPTSISNFPPSLLQFSFFSCQFSSLFHFFLASFFPIRQQKFPDQNSRGGGGGGGRTLPPLPPLPVMPLLTTFY